MSMSDKLSEKVPANLALSISNLWDRIGQSQNILLGLLVNLSLAATGVAIVLLFNDPVISTVGASWAILNLTGIIKWVFGL